jgi:CHAT domain-containing protein
MTPWPALLLALLAVQPGPADSLRLLARRLPDSGLVGETRVRPLAVRDAVSEMLSRSVNGPAAAREEELAAARRLARAYAMAWRDSFLLREVTRFIESSPHQRTAKVSADSVRRAGVAAFAPQGPVAAIAIWKRALSRSAAIEDTAGVAATLGNIGAGFARLEQLDSATGYLERARNLAAIVGNLRVEANAQAELAGVSERRGDLAAARDGYAAALRLRERIGDSRGQAADYNNLAALSQLTGDLDEARNQLEAALAINRRDGRDEVAATNLVNLAGLAAFLGSFGRAEALYRQAVAIWRARGQWTDVADARRGLGELELRRGDYPAARSELRAALTIYTRTGLSLEALAVREELAGVLGAMGELQDALDELRRAQRLADSTGATPGLRAGLALARADLAVQLNDRAGAERLYSGAELLYRRAGDRNGQADAQQGLGQLRLARDDFVRAQELLTAAQRSQLGAGNRRAAALTTVSLAQLSVQRGDTTTARKRFDRAVADLLESGDPVAAAAALGNRAALELAAGFPAAADSLFRAALNRVGGRIAPEVTWGLHAGLGAIHQKRGALDEAARELRASITDIERSGRSLALPERRSGYLMDKWDVYSTLAFVERARGRNAAGFEVSERIRARGMYELLAQGRVASPADTAAELIAREQDYRRRIAELTHELEGNLAGPQTLRGPDLSRANAVTREALLAVQRQYSELLLEVRDHAPQHAALVSSQPPSWEAVAGRLRPGEAFLEYLLGEVNSVVFVITRDTLAVVTLNLGRQALGTLVDFARGTLEPRGTPRVDSLWRGPLRQLHRELIAPIEESGLLAGKTRLVVVPQAELHYLPFAALLDPTSGRFLVERYEVSVTPSASVWLALADRRRKPAGAGLLALAPRPDALPATRQEVTAIERIAGLDTKTFTGSSATEATFRREAPTRRVLHLATYGVLNKQNPLFSYVELAAGTGGDSRLEVHEVFGLQLNAELVVLSACQTMLGSGSLTDVPAGDDWVGLARAFLHAGAARVMASLWPVRDRATAVLMEQFYQGFGAGADPEAALAKAQRSLLKERATAHPYYWAGFEVVGGR